jgi:hypothetical protein
MFSYNLKYRIEYYKHINNNIQIQMNLEMNGPKQGKIFRHFICFINNS